MSDTKFTPGPWGVTFAIMSGEEVAAVEPVGLEDDYRVALVVDEAGGDDHTLPANAHLIAAAPDLYEALENLLAVHLGEGGTKPNACDMAEAALAKARGEL